MRSRRSIPRELGTLPFLRAPLLLLVHPVVFTAVMGGAVILGMVVAMTPQFLSSAASEALTLDLSGRCASSYAGSMAPRRSLGSEVRFPGISEENRGRIAAAVGDQANVAAPRATIIGRTLFLIPEGGPTEGFNMTLLYRDGYDQNIGVLSGGGANGLWVDEYAAKQYGVDVGDTLTYEFSVTLPNGSERTITGAIAVSAVTEEHVGVRTEDFWCGLSDIMGLSPTGDRLTPVGLAPLSMFGDAEFSDLEGPDDAFYLRSGEFWELPVETEGLSLSIAGEILTSFDQVGRDVMSSEDGVQSDLEFVAGRVGALLSALTTSVRPLAVVVVVVAFGLIGGAGSYWVDRRKQELQLLSAFGIGPASLGTKAALEMFLPIALGVGTGALVSIPASHWVGPGGAIEPDAIRQGLLLSLPAAGLALLLAGAVAGLRSGRLVAGRKHKRVSTWWSFPLAGALMIGGYLLRRQIGSEAVLFGEAELVGSVDPLVIFFPLLIFTAAGLLAAETLLYVSSRLRDTWSNHSYYLAIRRMTSTRAPVVVLLVGALIPVATLLYSSALTRTTEDSIETKGGVFIGSDVRAPIYDFDPLPSEIADNATYVQRSERVAFGPTEVDFLVVDPATFAGGSFWREEFADVPLAVLLEVLEGRHVPLNAVAGNAPLGSETGDVDLGPIQVPVEIRATTLTFPGARVQRPIIVVGREAYEAYVDSLGLTTPVRDGTLKQVWVRGLDSDSVEAALNSGDVGFAFTTTIDEALDLTKFQAIIWTFDFLELYAALAGMIVVGAVLLYADTRQRTRNLSYALSLRMGLTRREHLLAGFMEFGSIVLGGAIVGCGTAYLAARSIFESLDPLPLTPPPPIWSSVTGPLVVLVSMSIAVSAIAAFVSQRTADSADVTSLLRHGE